MTPKLILKRAVYYSGLTGALRLRQSGRRVWILRYHSVSGPEDQNFRYLKPSIAVTPRVFEIQIAYVSSRYTVISLDDLAAWLAGEFVLERDAAVITFDDGYRDNYRHAYPILKKHRVSATFFVVTGAIGNGRPLWSVRLRDMLQRARATELLLPAIDAAPLDLADRAARDRAAQAIGRVMRRASSTAREELFNEISAKLGVASGGFLENVMMSWDEVREMKRGGMGIGSHTMSHPLLPEISREEALAEIAGSRARLEAELDAPVRHFAYPNPGAGVHVNDLVKALVRECGYRTARASRKGAVHEKSDPFELTGMSLDDRSDHPALLAWMLDGKLSGLRGRRTRQEGGCTVAPIARLR